MALLGLAAAAPPVDVGAAGALLAWQRAAEHIPLPALTLTAAVRTDRGFGGTVELTGARTAERNRAGSIVAWTGRAAVTADASLYRLGVAGSLGTGPALVVHHAVVAGDGDRWQGQSASPGWRARLALDGVVWRAVRWRAFSGATLRLGGVDFDVGVGFTVRAGASP